MSDDSVRLDKWLWAVRLFKTRNLAADVISGKNARITRHGQTMRTNKPSFGVRIGDVVTIMKARQLYVVEVLDLPERRLSAPDAALCYQEPNAEEQSHDA
ncbi:MAG: RNA-binding S4 domain-containing protein [Parvularculaceae bacterium]|nr:RNA-binding S4 domain-containing protein [Parvularculaceae bacterium]